MEISIYRVGMIIDSIQDTPLSESKSNNDLIEITLKVFMHINLEVVVLQYKYSNCSGRHKNKELIDLKWLKEPTHPVDEMCIAANIGLLDVHNEVDALAFRDRCFSS